MAISMGKCFCQLLASNLFKFQRVLTYSQAVASANKIDNIDRKIVSKIEQLFEIRTYHALDLLRKHKKIQTISIKTLTKNYNLCKNYEINKNVILDNADVLTEVQLSNKLEIIKELPFSLETTLILATMKHDKLERLLFHLKPNEETGPGGKIQVLADVLKTTPEQVCKDLVNKTFLANLEVSRIQNNIKLLLDYGVNIDEIRRDLWVLRYSSEHLQERLKFAKENNVERIKTWMMRATNEIFETYLRRRSDNKSVLGDSSLIEYLSNKLECSPEFAKSILHRQPALKNKSMKKMREIIDFLLSQGFETGHICRVPKILLHSVETSKKRLKELEDQGVHMKSVHILTKSQKQYRQYYESLLKINQSKYKNKYSEEKEGENKNDENKNAKESDYKVVNN